ncbi:MAG: hypothetical protein HY000_00055 [Planctomycetes bacterium]|nr:hypothetical protein [Planctomycetota bacterium]
MASTDVEPTTTTPSAHSANDLQGAKSQTAPPCDGHERTAETAEPILIDLDAAPRLNKIIPTEPTSFQVWLVLKFIAQAAAQRADILEMLYKLRTGEHKVANGNTKGALIALREDGCVEFLLVNGRGVVKITELGLRRESAYAAAQANARSEHEAKQAAAQNEWEEMTRRPDGAFRHPSGADGRRERNGGPTRRTVEVWRLRLDACVQSLSIVLANYQRRPRARTVDRWRSRSLAV